MAFLFRYKEQLRQEIETLTALNKQVQSVLDTALYTLARSIADGSVATDFGKTDREKGVMIQCAHCGRFFYPRDGRQKYCTDHDCFKSRKALYKRGYRAVRAQAKVQSVEAKGCLSSGQESLV